MLSSDVFLQIFFLSLLSVYQNVYLSCLVRLGIFEYMNNMLHEIYIMSLVASYVLVVQVLCTLHIATISLLIPKMKKH